MAVTHSLKFTVLFSFDAPYAVTLCHSFAFVFTRCHLLLLVVIFLCHSLSFVAIRFHTLSLVVPLVFTRCRSLSLVVPLAVTPRTSRLSFYKQSWNTNTFFQNVLEISLKHNILLCSTTLFK